MNKLVKIVTKMSEEDLLRIRRDLEEGNIKRLIELRLDELGDENKVCPVCGRNTTGEDYKLEFGKVGLRMRASFDATDCLKHFLRDLEKGNSSSSSS